MNIALRSIYGNEYYLASIRRTKTEFIVAGKRINQGGHVIAVGQSFSFASQKEAEKRIKDLVKTKVKRKGWTPVDLENLPRPVVRLLVVPDEMQVTPEELVLVLRSASKERYVVFKNVCGLEEYFDSDVEYIGYVTDEENVVKVFDRFGVLRDCFTDRMRSVIPTERSLEAGEEKVKRLIDTFGAKGAK